MFRSIVKAKLAADEPVLLLGIHLYDPAVWEMVGLMGFDCIWVDLEHHAHSVERVQNLIRAARIGAGVDTMSRCALGEFMRIGRLLEIGSQGILYPRCASPDEARQVVQAAKFHPLGIRGFDGGNRDMPFCDMPIDEYVKMANDETFIFVQLEEPSAVDQAYEIASVEGVDGVFFGPADFTVLSGVAGQFDHPSVEAAVHHIADAAGKAGKAWGMPTPSPQRAQQLIDMGARIIATGADIIYVKNGLEKVQDDYERLGFRFRNQMPSAAKRG